MDQEGRNRAASTSSQSGSPPPKTASQGNFLLLPMLTKHYKTTLLLLLVWLIGYLGFSTTWILIGFFFYVVNEEYRKVKAAKRSFSQEAGQDEKAAILARVDELPAWVYFPDIERAEWLNKMIHQMWPYIGDYVKQLLKDTVQPIVDNALPGSLKPFKFEHIDLGDTPPRIGGVKVYSENVRRDEVIMDLEIFYAGDAEVKVAVRGMNAGIKHLTIHGIIRVVFKPLVPIVPLIGGMNVFFLNRPSVDFDLTNIANLLDTPVLSNTLRTVVEDLIAAYLVLPNKIPIQLVSSIDVNALKFPMPHGVLRLHIVAARDLLKADTTLMGKSSDPYTKLYLGNHTFKTNTIKNNINPVWNKFYEVAVDQKHGQVVELEVLDEDPGKDDELGTASIPIENVVNQGFIDSWLPLENVKTGLIHVRALWFHLSKDPEDLDRIGQSTDEGMRPSTEEHLSSALLIVNVDSAKSLPRGKKSMSEPSPYVNLGVGNTKEKSIVKPKTTDPRWEASFQFMVHNPRVQELYLEILDSKKGSSKDGGVVDSSKGDKKLGYINYPIKNLLTAKDLTVHRPFQLKDSSPNASVTLRMSLRIMTSEKPEEWALDHSDVPQTPSATSVASTPEENTTPEKRQPSPAKKTAAQEEVVRPQSQSVVGASRGTADLNENLDKNFTLGGDSSDGASLGSVNDGLRRRGTSLSSSLAPFGRIQLTVRYSSARNKLVLCIHQCINLIACDDDNLADPYVKVYLLPEKSSKKKTQVFKNNLNPVYDETFEWSLPQAELSGKMLHLTVKNSVGFLSRGQKEMGQLYIDVSNITASRTEWFDLLDPDTDKDSQTSL